MLKNLFLDVYQINKWLLFLFYVLFLAFASMVTEYFLPIEDILHSSFAEQLSNDRIQKLVAVKKKWQWLNYLAIPIVLAIKWFLTSTCLYLGTFFYPFPFSFKKAFHFVLIGELVFLIAILFRVFWLYANRFQLSIESIQYFQPFSLNHLIGHEGLDTWLIYPLQVLNLFELSYFVLLSFFIAKETKKTFWKSVDFVISTYGLGLLIWVVFVCFLSLNFSQ